MKITFWISLFIVFYTFAGYGIVLYFLVKIRRLIKGKRPIPDINRYFPTLTLIVAAYNDGDIKNGVRLQRPVYPYPKLPAYVKGDANKPDSYKGIAYKRRKVLAPAKRYLR